MDSGFRIVLDLSQHFNDIRSKCYMYVDLGKDHVISDVERRIKQNFGINSDISLLCNGCFLPSVESTHILQTDDIVRVVDGTSSHGISTSGDPSTVFWSRECTVSPAKLVGADLKHESMMETTGCDSEDESLLQSSNICIKPKKVKKHKEKQIHSSEDSEPVTNLNLNSNDDKHSRKLKKLENELCSSTKTQFKRKSTDVDIKDDNVQTSNEFSSGGSSRKKRKKCKVKFIENEKEETEKEERNNTPSGSEWKKKCKKQNYVDLDCTFENSETVEPDKGKRNSKKLNKVQILDIDEKNAVEAELGQIENKSECRQKSEELRLCQKNYTVNNNKGENSERCIEPDLNEIKYEGIEYKNRKVNIVNEFSPSVTPDFKQADGSVKKKRTRIRRRKKKHINESYMTEKAIPEIIPPKKFSPLTQNHVRFPSSDEDNEAISGTNIASLHGHDETLPLSQVLNKSIEYSPPLIECESQSTKLITKTRWDSKPFTKGCLRIDNESEKPISYEALQNIATSTPLIFEYKNTQHSISTINQNLNDDITSATPSSNGEKVDLEKYPALQEKPKKDDIIAFKVLKLSDDYTPELSEYITAKVRSFCTTTETVDFLVMNGYNQLQQPKGKFHLEDTDNDVIENTTDMHLNWNEVKDARLMYP